MILFGMRTGEVRSPGKKTSRDIGIFLNDVRESS